MTKSFLLATLCVLLVVQQAIGSGLTINMDALPQINSYHLEAKFNKDNDIVFQVEYLNNSSDVEIRFDELTLKASRTGFQDELIPNYLDTCCRSTAVFRYSKIINKSFRYFERCPKIDHTNDALCQFTLWLLNPPKQDPEEPEPISFTFYARIQNSTVGVEPTVRLFGSSRFEGDVTEISQRNAYITQWYAKGTRIEIAGTHRSWERFTHNYNNPILNLTLREDWPLKTMKFDVKPKFYYFRYQNKLVEVFDNNTLAAVNGSSLNLTSFGFSFDRNVSIAMKLITTDVHSGSNLIPIDVYHSLSFYPKPQPKTTIHSLLTKAGGFMVNKIFGKRKSNN